MKNHETLLLETALVTHFIRQYSVRNDKLIEGINPSATMILESHSWPGNIRQLEHVIEAAVVHSEGSMLISEDIRKALNSYTSTSVFTPSHNIFKCQLTGIEISRAEGELAQKITGEVISNLKSPIKLALICPRTGKMREEAKRLNLPETDGFGWALLLLWYSNYWQVGGGDEKNLPQVQRVFKANSVNSVWRKTRDIIKSSIKQNRMPKRSPKSDNIKNEYASVFRKWLHES